MPSDGIYTYQKILKRGTITMKNLNRNIAEYIEYCTYRKRLNSKTLKPLQYRPELICGFLCRQNGRRIDLLRTAIYNIENIAGKEAYDFPILFWQEGSCLLDNFNGKKSAATKPNLMVLCARLGRKS